MKIFILTTMLALLYTTAFSQERSNMSTTWFAIKTFDVQQGVWTDENTSLVNIGGNRMEWRNADGSVRKTFQIIETLGEWVTLGDEGSVQYEVADGDDRGTITIYKKIKGSKALISITSTSFELTLTNE